MEHNKYPSTLADCKQENQNEFLQQTRTNEFAKEEDSDVQKSTIPKIEAKAADTKAPKPFSARMTPRNVQYSSDSYSSDSESDSASHSDTNVIAEEDSDVQKSTIPKIEPKAADTKAPKPFSARMTPRNVHYSSDSYSSDSESDSASESDTKVIAEEDSDVQKSTIPKIEPKAADTKAPKPFLARMTPRNVHYSSDSYSSDSESNSASDSDTKVIGKEDYEVRKLTLPKIEARAADTKATKLFSARMTPRSVRYSSDSSYFPDSGIETIAEEESKIQKENSPKDMAKELEFQPNAAHEEEKTHAQPKEALDFDPGTEANKSVLVQVTKSSTTDLISRPNVPASSILVKHGTKRPAEAGDKNSKRAKTTQE